ncbi:MAG TPA: CvpA family protein [Planctomycetota bacterium]|nr:CvpA family protein [Planctomycetota bacterium]
MWIDLSLALAIILCGVMGLFQGILTQLFRVGGLVLIVLYARSVTEPVGEWLARQFNLMPLVAYYVALVVGGLIIYAFCAFAGRAVSRMLKKRGGTAHGANRVLGGLVGLVHGLVIAFLAASVLQMVPHEALGDYPRLQTDLRSSRAVPLVADVNPLPQLRFLRYVDDYKALLSDPQAQEIFERPPEFVKLRDNPKFREAVSDPKLLELIEQKRWPEVVVQDKVVSLLFDPEVREILNRLNPRAALEEADRVRAQKTPGT